MDMTGEISVFFIEEAEKNWSVGGEGLFDILEVSEDGKHIGNELLDLNRDAGTFEIAERVSHGPAGEQAPGLEMYGTSDEEADRALQEYLKRGKS